MLAEVLPEAARIAEAADIFLERGAFDAAQARRYLQACKDAGLCLRLHGDQFTEQGAIPLAIELGARSVDHLEATGGDGVRALAASDVVGVLLSASALFLGRPMPPARALVDAGAAVALATDFNPGSAFTESLPLVCSLACTQLKLSPAEALAAVTVNAAHVLRRANRIGRLAPGYRADVVLLDAPDWRYLAYHLAGDIVAAVVADCKTALTMSSVYRFVSTHAHRFQWELRARLPGTDFWNWRNGLLAHAQQILLDEIRARHTAFYRAARAGRLKRRSLATARWIRVYLLTVETLATAPLGDEVAYRLQSGILDGTCPPGMHLLRS